MWYFRQLDGVTFGVREPIVKRGEKFLSEYERYPSSPDQRYQAELLAHELPMVENIVYLVFLYGKFGSLNWGQQSLNIAIIGDEARLAVTKGVNYQRYVGLGIMAHELGHAIGGLADVFDKVSIMDNNIRDGKLILNSFPAVDFTASEKDQLRMFMR